MYDEEGLELAEDADDEVDRAAVWEVVAGLDAVVAEPYEGFFAGEDDEAEEEVPEAGEEAVEDGAFVFAELCCRRCSRCRFISASFN